MTLVAAGQVAWIAALAGLVWLWALALRRARDPSGYPVASRGLLLGAALATALLGAGGAWIWAGAVAQDGLARIAAGADPGRAPARARLFLRHVQLIVPPAGEAAVGYAPASALLLPRDYGLAEARRGRDLFAVSAPGPLGIGVRSLVEAGSPTRVLVGVGRTPAVVRTLAPGGRCLAPTAAPVAGPDEVTVVVVCDGDRPRAALVLDRELGVRGAAAADVAVRVHPLVWRGGGFHRHHVQLEAGTLLQIGAGLGALPGLTLWEIPGPAGRPGLLFPPRDLLAGCAAWTQGNAGGGDGGFFYPSLGVVEPPAATPVDDDAFACVLPFAPPFALEVRRLLPDPPGVLARTAWGASLMIAPALALLLLLALSRPSERPPGRAAAALGFAVVSSIAAAVVIWRLLWAYRLDMMRDYEPVATRVLANTQWTLVAAAAFGATAVALWRRRAAPGPLAVEAGLALAGWAGVFAAGSWALDAPLEATPRLVTQALVSLVLGLGATLWPLAAARLPAHRVPLFALAGLSLAALLGAWLVPRMVALKLLAAWSFAPAAYLALRTRTRAAALLVPVALVALAIFDTGVAAVIAGLGLCLALLVAAHDAVHDTEDTRHPVRFGRHFRPLLVVQAGAALALAVPLALWALGGLAGDAASGLVPLQMTHGALHVLLFLAALFAVVAVAIARKSQGWRVAAPWALAAVAFAGLWGARDLVVHRVVASSGEASARVASILDPAYALVADERAFSKGLTAWRETASSAPLADGEGYFGAQVVDPGVLLSIENDYLPILILRETGAVGLARLAAVFLLAAFALWLCGGGRFAEGSASLRARRVVALLLGLIALYQPIASLGALPFTGIAWPGLGVDSPSDLWIFLALLLACGVWEDAPAAAAPPRRRDSELRATRDYRRVAVLLGVAATAMAVAGTLLVLRAGAFALRRKEPVAERIGEAGEPVVSLEPPFDRLEPVLDWVHRMQCAPAALTPERPLLPPPAPGTGLARFHDRWRDAWDDEVGAARDRLARVRAGDLAACAGRDGHWGFEPRGSDCVARFDFGWPVVRFVATPGAKDEPLACDVDVPEDVLRAFRYPPRRPYAGARVRLVSRPLGRSTADRGELVAGSVLVRLRPGAGRLDLATVSAGIFWADRVELEGGIVVSAGTPVTVQRTIATPRGERPARVLTARTAPRVHVYGADDARWDTRLLQPAETPTPLDTLSVIVTGGAGKSVWLFRPADAAPLLADDVVTVLGGRRRVYAYGGFLPELGWVNPASDDKSLGLDGWAHAATARYERSPGAGGASPAPGTPSVQARFARAQCALVAPPVPAEAGADADQAFAEVCSPSAVDGILECRVSLQPELAIRLGHLLELTAQRPELFAAPKLRPYPATQASYALLRGDSGEILAQGNFVPGRESTAYAPGSPSLERYLVDARDERREESGAEKADWGESVAIGSLFKPLLGAALERAAPDAAAAMLLTASGRREGCEPILGHCPPTKTLWNHPEVAGDMGRFLADSLNWVQAAIGLLGTALPDGELGFGAEPAALSFPLAVESVAEDRALWTRHGGRDVIVGGAIDVAALRQTPMWRELEALLGRPLCEGGKRGCREAAARRDLCAVRALPVDKPTADLRHLVALGPAGFDFAESDQARRRQPLREYLQLLRGAGKHPIGSTLQVAEAYTRLFFDEPQPRYRLAASWFPVPPVGKLPAACSPGDEGRGVRGGLCRALTTGTAAALGRKIGAPGLVFYGAKTGTIDSLGDVAESRAACERWNRNHTIAGAKEQPYHLDCRDPERKDLNDSLLAVGFGVRQWGGEILPLTLVVRYQRVGSGGDHGFAVDAAGAFIDVIVDYFAAR